MDNPETVLYSSKAKSVGMLTVSLFFVAGGVWIGLRGDSIGYLCSAFFGLCALVFIVQMLPGASYLRLSSDFFEFTSLFRRTTVRWNDVSDFGIITQRQMGAKVHQMVGWNYVSTGEKRGIGRSLSHAVSGMEAGLPDTYSLPIEALLEVMQRHWQIAKEEAEQGGTGQPATRSQSKSEGSDKPKPEAEGRSR